jgi:chromosome segregation ATPase
MCAARLAEHVGMCTHAQTDARIRAEELAVEAVRWKEDQGQYQWDAQGGNRSLEQDEDSEIKSLRKMVLHLESRIAEKDAEHTSAKHSQVQQQVASLERQLASYQDQAKHWETLRQQLCTRIAQLEGKHSASTASQQHDAVQARKFEILATQVRPRLALATVILDWECNRHFAHFACTR